ncbi:MAG: hypothetical protein L0212_00220 [Acidobacteria bacterium]|nr:hypothetical protein [Acidobacteriota bacterium]
MDALFLNAVYTKPSMRRRYEVWFLRLGLADGSGAWWFRYLLMNPGRGGCPTNERGQPVQVWATWFPLSGAPQSFIKGFSMDGLALSAPRATPFSFEQGPNRIGEDECRGRVEVGGHRVEWDLRYRSTFGTTVTDVGWIGFSRTPHSDAVFSGEIVFDGRRFSGEPLGFGLQGHNRGFRHRRLWNWTHCLFQTPGGLSTFEALEYEIPLGRRVRRALLWHEAQLYRFTEFEELLRNRAKLRWAFKCFRSEDQTHAVAVIDGSGPSLHRLPYLKTDCSGTFEVANNSFARATLYLLRPDKPALPLSTDTGAALEMVGV